MKKCNVFVCPGQKTSDALVEFFKKVKIVTLPLQDEESQDTQETSKSGGIAKSIEVNALQTIYSYI